MVCGDENMLGCVLILSAWLVDNMENIHTKQIAHRFETGVQSVSYAEISLDCYRNGCTMSAIMRPMSVFGRPVRMRGK